MSGRVIVITSGKGGVGKTTTSANIGTALAKTGASVVLVDTDIGLRNLDLLLGLENRIVYTLVDVVEERCKLKQALVKDKKNPNMCLLAAAQTRDKTAVTQEQLKDIEEKFDDIAADEAIVFELIDDEENGDTLQIVMEEEVVNQVFDEYKKMLEADEGSNK